MIQLDRSTTTFGPKALVLCTPVPSSQGEPHKKGSKCIFHHAFFFASQASSLYTARVAGMWIKLPPVTHTHFHVGGHLIPRTGASFQQLGAHAYF